MSTRKELELIELSDAELDEVTGGFLNFNFGQINQAAANVAGLNLLSAQVNSQHATLIQIS
jgi:hypothetical protein